MLKVVILKNNDKYKKINLLGHTEYADYGKDIVCSAVSAITTTTVNAILSFNKASITYQKKKDNFVIIINENNEIVDNLINNMINMLKDLSNDYPKNIEIKEE